MENNNIITIIKEQVDLVNDSTNIENKQIDPVNSSTVENKQIDPVNSSAVEDKQIDPVNDSNNEDKHKVNKNKKMEDTILFPNGLKFFANVILKLENKLSQNVEFKLNIPDHEFVRRLTNTLIVCNHDLFILDFYAIPYLLRKYNIPLSILVNEGFVNKYGTVFDNMTQKFDVKLISRKNSVTNIIDNINNGRSVMILYDPFEYLRIDERKSLPIIINTTKCRPVYLYYRTNVRLKKHNIMYRRYYTKYNIKNIMNLFFCSLIGQQVIIYVKVSENFDTYDDFIKHKNYIKPIYIK